MACIANKFGEYCSCTIVGYGVPYTSIDNNVLPYYLKVSKCYGK